MEIEGNDLKRHSVKAGMPQGSPLSPILFAMHTAGLMQWLEESVQAEGLSVVDDLGWVATGKDMKQVVNTPESCTAEIIEWATRLDLQFNSAKMEPALFTCRRCHRKHLLPKPTAQIEVQNGIVQFNHKTTR